MVYLHTKKSILDIFMGPLFSTWWSILWAFGIFCGNDKHFIAIRNILCQFGTYVLGQLVCLGAIWYIFIRFGRLYHEKSGNTDLYIETFSLA
jgi:hypothetical protein